MKPIQTPPRTTMEVFKMLPEGTLAEIINGTMFMSPAPTPVHQRILGDLFVKISSHITKHKSGELFLAPCDVYLDEKSNAVQPDLIFVALENSHLIGSNGIHGVPDLLIEILSPGNSSHDLILKKELYQTFCVKEYWVVDPESKQTVGFYLKDNKFIDSQPFIGKIVSVLLNQEFIF